MVEVIQSDRDAAADIWRDYVAKIGECLAETGIRSGGVDDGSLVQTIARHRQQAEARAEGLVAALEKIELMDTDYTLGPDHNLEIARDIARDALTAYRSGKTIKDTK